MDNIKITIKTFRYK
ncbi:hypothetical protein YPPY102_0850, partial [Yersinia pestis PY-102]